MVFSLSICRIHATFSTFVNHFLPLFSDAFKTLSDIVAKGYKDPVGTFMPNFAHNGVDTVQTHSRLMTRASYDFYAQGGAENGVAAALSAVQTLRREQSAQFSVTESYKKTYHNTSRVLKKLLKSNFYLKIDNGMSVARGSFSQPRVKAKLHGRRFEIQSILLFLFTALTDMPPAATGGHFGMSSDSLNLNLREGLHKADTLNLRETLQKSDTQNLRDHLRRTMSTDSVEGHSVKNTFKTNLPARFVGVIAGEGLGKSALVSALSQQLFSTVNGDVANNIHLFKSRHNSFQLALPFNAWKPIIREMLTRIYHVICLRTQSSSPIPGNSPLTTPLPSRKPKNRRSLVAGVSHTESDITAAVDYTLSMLTPELQSLRPLLGDLGILKADTEAIEALGLSNAEKLSKSCELLRNIVQSYVSITNNLIFITV